MQELISLPRSTDEGVVAFKIPVIPPSVNAVWRSGRRDGKTFVYKSNKYTTWLKLAGQEWMMQKGKLKTRRIEGKFAALIEITPPDKRRRDLDNIGTKALFDLCVQLGLIEDDSLARLIVIRMTEPDKSTSGVTITIWPYR